MNCSRRDPHSPLEKDNSMVLALRTGVYKLEHALAKLCNALAIQLLHMSSIQDHQV